MIHIASSKVWQRILKLDYYQQIKQFNRGGHAKYSLFCSYILETDKSSPYMSAMRNLIVMYRLMFNSPDNIYPRHCVITNPFLSDVLL